MYLDVYLLVNYLYIIWTTVRCNGNILEVSDAIVQFTDGLPARTLGFIFFEWAFLIEEEQKKIWKILLLNAFEMVEVLPRHVVFGLLRLISISAKMVLQTTLQESCQDQPMNISVEISW